MQQYIGIIPARYGSSRFPGKPLVDILGKSMIQRVYEQSLKSSLLQRVIVATDDSRIEQAVLAFGGEVFITSDLHESGTDRCAEVCRMLGSQLETSAVIINIQGDEPFIDPGQIDVLCRCFDDENVDLASLYRSFQHVDELSDPNSIKVVTDKNNRALYFSRLPIPYHRDNDGANLSVYKRHIGIYGYRSAVLQEVSSMKMSLLETLEKLEQLRWLEAGLEIQLAQSEHASWSVDTPEDLKKIIERFHSA